MQLQHYGDEIRPFDQPLHLQCADSGQPPVYNSAYTTTLYNNKDNDFNFEFAQFDQLNFNDEQIDNQLVALFAYYAYLIIGLDLDSFSPMGGEEVLQRCLYLANNAQNLDFPGWKAFDNDRNRFAIINDYLEGAMKPFRQLQYDYYRKGLDEMANNVERGRTNITTALEELKKAHEDKPLSMLPQIWTDYKKDELANIYKGKGTQKGERDRLRPAFLHQCFPKQFVGNDKNQTKCLSTTIHQELSHSLTNSTCNCIRASPSSPVRQEQERASSWEPSDCYWVKGPTRRA